MGNMIHKTCGKCHTLLTVKPTLVPKFVILRCPKCKKEVLYDKDTNTIRGKDDSSFYKSLKSERTVMRPVSNEKYYPEAKRKDIYS